MHSVVYTVDYSSIDFPYFHICYLLAFSFYFRCTAFSSCLYILEIRSSVRIFQFINYLSRQTAVPPTSLLLVASIKNNFMPDHVNNYYICHWVEWKPRQNNIIPYYNNIGNTYKSEGLIRIIKRQNNIALYVYNNAK